MFPKTTKKDRNKEFVLDLSIDELQKQLKGLSDIQFEKLVFPVSWVKKLELDLIFSKDFVDTKMFMTEVLPKIRSVLTESPEAIKSLHKKTIFPVAVLKKELTIEEMVNNIFTGSVILVSRDHKLMYSITIPEIMKRSITEPNTEVSLLGPKDGFIEDLSSNVSLIRRRIKTASLKFKKFSAGKRTRTAIGLLYIEDIIDPDIVKQVEAKLKKIDTDAITSHYQIEQYLAARKFEWFPLLSYTGRPDFAVSSLLNGRFVIMVDGNPTVIIGPTNLSFLLNTAEDTNTLTTFVVFERIIRNIGLAFSMFVPGFWVAIISFHQDQIPFTLLSTLILSRQGVPFPAALETFIMLFLFEIFKEAGMRLPMAVGQTLSVVGGIIIGQAAISAGLSAPGNVVISALAVVATYTLVNQSLIASVTLARFFILFLSSILGLYGYFIGSFIVLTYLANLKSFNKPYLEPFAPLVLKDFSRLFFPMTWLRRKRPEFLKTKDQTVRERGRTE